MHPVALLEQRIESTHTAESARHRDVGHRQRRVGEQAFREQQALRLRIADRRDTELGLEHAAQMASRHAEARGHLREIALFEKAVLDQARGRMRDPPWRIDARIARCKLGTAAQARAKPGMLGCGGTRIERAVLAQRRACRADRTAIDPGRGDRDEELSVEARVSGLQRAETVLG